MLPLVQCAAADYRLRAESVALLRELGITDAMLTFGGNATDDAVRTIALLRTAAQLVTSTPAGLGRLCPRAACDTGWVARTVQVSGL